MSTFNIFCYNDNAYLYLKEVIEKLWTFSKFWLIPINFVTDFEVGADVNDANLPIATRKEAAVSGAAAVKPSEREIEARSYSSEKQTGRYRMGTMPKDGGNFTAQNTN